MEKKRKISKINLRLPVCIILATFLWLYVMTEKNPEIIFSYYEVPVKILNENTLAERNLSAMNLKDFTATVSVRGLKSDILSFKEGNISASIDLSGYGEGKMKVPVQISLKEPKYDLTVDKTDPSFFTIQFDRIITEEKHVRINTSGEVAEGSVLGDIIPDFETVTIKGPKSLVDEVQFAEATVNLEGKNDDLAFFVPLKLKDADGEVVKGLSVKPEEVTGRIPIKNTASLPVSLKYTGALPEGFAVDNIEYSPKEIQIIGDKKDLQSKEIFTKPIDLNSFVENQAQDIELEIPKNLKLQNPDSKIHVVISFVKEIEKTEEINYGDIRVVNPPDDLKYSIINEGNIKITLKGKEEFLDNFRPMLFVKFEDREYEEGEVSLKLESEVIPEGVKMDIIPQSVDIKLEKKEKDNG